MTSPHELPYTAFDVIIGTPFNQSDFIIESSEEVITSGIATSSNPAVVRMNNTLQVTDSDFPNRMKGIRVRATDENPIYVLVVFMYNDFGFFQFITGYGSYLVHPNNEFPAEGDYVYFAVSFESTQANEKESNMLIVGNHNETSISITPTQNVHLPADAQSNSSLIEVLAGTTHNVTLNSFQTLGFFAVLDLTGTKIVSDKPLTVITGHRCAQIPSTEGFCEPLYIHLPPTFNWGQTFFLAPFGGRDADQYYKVVTSENLTKISYRCNDNSIVSLQSPTAGTGHILSISSNSFCYLSASSPIFLVHMATGFLSDILGDPAIAIVAPTTRYIKSANFLSIPAFSNNFITVTVQAEHFNSSQILLDGNNLACDWNSIRNIFSDDIVGYGCTYNVSSGSHTVTHSRELGLLSVVAYGWKASPSLGYAYLTNFNLKLHYFIGMLMLFATVKPPIVHEPSGA